MPSTGAGARLRAAPATELRPPAATRPEDTFVLAVDLGTGGPKVAVLSATGRIAAHAFEPVAAAESRNGRLDFDSLDDLQRSLTAPRPRWTGSPRHWLPKPSLWS